jgi:DNA-binding NarL/FixJ family response regulator
MTVRVLLGDEHRSFVEALALRLNAENGLTVVGTVVQPEDAVRIVASRQVDVAILSVGPGPDSFVMVGSQLLKLHPELKLVAVAAQDDTELLARAVVEGFRGWVSKDVGIRALLDAMYGVIRGETWIPPLMLSQLMPYLLGTAEAHKTATDTLGVLTAREQEVLKAMAGGLSRREIATQMAISSNTVRTHMQSILSKLGVHSSLAAVAVARRAGLS